MSRTLTLVFTTIAFASAIAPCDAAPSAAPVSAVAPAADAAIRKAMHAAFPGAAIEAIHPTPVAGLMEVVTSGAIVYVSSDGQFAINGDMLAIASHRNLSERARAASRRALLAGVGATQEIVFAPTHPKYTVTVFTDVDCGYCRKLHAQVADYNRVGIAIDYVFYPRSGLGSESFDKAVSVWCAADRQKAFTDAKKGLSITKATCANPVTKDYELGTRLGVDGTPSIYAADGTQIGGYLTPADMKEKLDELAAQSGS